jgi:hypothetical protein
MEALLEEELDLSQSTDVGVDGERIVAPPIAVDDGSGILWSQLESADAGLQGGVAVHSDFSKHVVHDGELYAYGRKGVVRWTGLRWEHVSLGPTRRLLMASSTLLRFGMEGEAQIREKGATWTTVTLPRAVLDASSIHGTTEGFVTLGEGRVTTWATDFSSREVRSDLDGATCLARGAANTMWVCHSGSLWPLYGSQAPVPLPRTTADTVSLHFDQGPADEWLAWSHASVWIHMDGQWSALERPSDAQLASVTSWGGQVWAADIDGLWRIQLESSAARQLQASVVPPLNILLRAAMNRADVSASTPSAVKAMWLPRVELEGSFNPSDRLTYMPDTGSAGSNDSSWGVMARLTWTPPGRTSALPWDGEDAGGSGDRLLFPSGNQRMVLLDQSALPRAVGSTRRSSRVRGEEIATRVADLYAQRLGYERDIVYEDVSEAVIALLEKQTVDALLDVYTEGAYSSWEGEEQ